MMSNDSLRSQFATSNSNMKLLDFSEFNAENRGLRSQIINKNDATQEVSFYNEESQISSLGRGGRRYLPRGFTEQGVAMLSAVLNTDKAIQVSIAIMEIFVQLRREKIAAQKSKTDQISQFFQLMVEEFRELKDQNQAILAAIGQIQKTKAQRPKAFLPNHIPSGSIEKMRSKIIAIQTAVAKYFCLKVEDLQIDTRRKSIALPRQIAIYLARQKTDLSLKEIAFLYDKDHSTVLYACEKIAAKVKVNAEFKDIIQNILSSIS